MAKTAFVYDKWLSSFGGGEVVACNIATALRDIGYQTTFISGQTINPDTIKNKLGIDMSKINFVQSFNDEQKILNITKNSDIFVNASFWDYSLSNSKKQFYYTSFPSKCSNFSFKSIVRTLFFNLIFFLVKPIENIDDLQSIIYFQKPNNKQRLSIIITLKEFSKSNLKNILIDLDNVELLNKKIIVNHFKNQIIFKFDFITLTNSFIINKKISLPKQNYSIKFKNILTTNEFPKLDSIIRAGNYHNPYHKIHQFDLIFANSSFTKKWINNYWNINANVLYPPVKLIDFSKKQVKENKICSIGRFFTLGHGKKQEILIEAFKKIYDSGIKNWQLHLAGGLGTEPSSLKYAHYLKNISKNYPIFFHFNQSREFIENLYLSSKIYWHAAGFGENPNINPIKFEHFGITPIEAISAGCIPILFNGGGLTEIIKLLDLNKNIHLYNSLDQLVTNTKIVINKKIKLPPNIYNKLTDTFSQNNFKNLFIEKLK